MFYPVNAESDYRADMGCGLFAAVKDNNDTSTCGKYFLTAGMQWVELYYKDDLCIKCSLMGIVLRKQLKL